MYPYICLTHALGNSKEANWLTEFLTTYGFRCRVLNEASDPSSRTKTLNGAEIVLALTSQEAHRAETVAADLRSLSGEGRAPLCISLEENPIDERFCSRVQIDRKAHTTRIPYPADQAPDTQTVGLFIHRLFIRHLLRLRDTFSPSLCQLDRYGQVIALAASALEGDRNAVYALGCAYERGDVLPVMEEEAVAWITRAAEAGLSDARLHLGELSLTGWGVEMDEARAFSLFASVANENDVRGEYRMALCYLNGAGVVPDPARAISHLRRAARWNYAPALYQLGLLYRDGIGTTPNARIALECFYRACKSRTITPPVQEVLEEKPLEDMLLTEDEAPAEITPTASFHTPSVFYHHAGRKATAVTMHHMCHHIAEKRQIRTLHASAFSTVRYEAIHRPEYAWIGSLTRSARINAIGGGQASAHPVLNMQSIDVAMGVPFDRSNAALALARLLETGDKPSHLRPHPTRALAWYRYALLQSNTEALFCLAEAYRHGRGTPTDPRWATVLYRISADWGDPRGQFSLAVAYERGLGVDADVAKAVHHYEQAAIAGYAPAQNNLGGCYEHGVGVARNILTAVEWYVRASKAGLPEAMCRLGLCYETGRGVPADPDRAFELYCKAADLRHPYALYRAGICYDRREQYTEAVRLWQAAAKAGLPDAAYTMAMCYSAGHGVRRDLDRAVSYLHDAAEGDCLQAIYRLALCFAEGLSVTRDTTRAAAYLRRAVRLWRTRKALYLADTAPIPPCAQTAPQAARDALYLLGICTAEGWEPNHANISAEARAREAEHLFTEAAEIGHVGAMIALGDLYAYRILQSEQDAEDVARAYYERAARSSAKQRGIPSPIGESSDESLPPSLSTLYSTQPDGLLSSSADRLALDASPALISLADEAVARGKAEKGVAADEKFRKAWRCYAAAVELGSADARIRMAECLYYGYGRTADLHAARRLLQSVEDSCGGRILAYLWLGDLWRNDAASPVSPEEADRAYCRGLTAPLLDPELSPYALSYRRDTHTAENQEARQALLYRLATLRAVYPPKEEDSAPTTDRSAFAFLCESMLAGCTAAQDDLARIYAYEQRYSVATAPADKGAQPRRRFLRRRPRRISTAQNVLRDHNTWLSDYYTALWPEPIPFSYELRSQAVPDHIPMHITAPVTPIMLAEVLNYLGDCFFFGKGLAQRPTAAVACYRKVTSTKIPQERGEAPPACVTWAQYSLGWCLLHGEGVAPNAREAVRWLTAASRSHPEACYALGECHEHGIGVDGVDFPEAIQYYRRALRFGHPHAERKARELQRLLNRIAAEN